ncbi:Type II secretion system protein F [Bremerella volcania]|uniref:Type II secretion system protein F n=1 Tax=Bremerella volcania TaxID=2527984 RepID=A0A518CAB5_9BACT|nr:type II secretion system F family protein [Bremerella volcania]QDU76161.1 Type II secretion system protein F [Bremerella volcania]
MKATTVRSGTASSGIGGFFHWLHSIQLTPGRRRKGVSPRRLGEVFSHLATLLENGVTLPKAILTIANESTMRWGRSLLMSLHTAIERGDSFSKALASQEGVFDEILIQQIRIGERSGNVPQVLRRISDKLETDNDLRGRIMKKLSYPAIVTLAGSGVCTFMILFILPVFEETYRKSKIPLPLPTQVLVNVGHFATSYGWIILLAVIGLAIVIRQLRKKQAFAISMDRRMLRLPLVGPWLVDMAMLQFMDALGTMLESGFHLADALAQCQGTVSNRAVDQAIGSLGKAVRRGERLSREMDRHQHLFPPVVSQLVIVGEQTGNLGPASRQIRDHLKKDVERKTDNFVRVVEPITTIMMALLVGGILLAIYMPMFGMLDLVEK